MDNKKEITEKILKKKSADLISKINSTTYGSPAYTRLIDTFRALSFPKIPELSIDINPQKTISRVQTLKEQSNQTTSSKPKKFKILNLFSKHEESIPVDIAVLQKFYRSNYKLILKMLDETTYTHFSLTAHREDLKETMQFTKKLEYYLLSVSEELSKTHTDSNIKKELEETILTKKQELQEYILIIQNAYLVNESLIEIYSNISDMLYDMRKKMQETLNYQTTIENKINTIENSFISYEKNKR